MTKIVGKYQQQTQNLKMSSNLSYMSQVTLKTKDQAWAL